MHSFVFRNRQRLQVLYGMSDASQGAGPGSWDGNQRQGVTGPAPSGSLERVADPHDRHLPQRWPVVERRGSGDVVLFPAVHPQAERIRRRA